MSIEFIIEKMKCKGDDIAVAVGDNSITYGQLLEEYQEWAKRLPQEGIHSGTVVAVKGDYSTTAIALVLALIELEGIIIPLSSDSKHQFENFMSIGEAEMVIDCSTATPAVERTSIQACHPLYQQLREIQSPGLVLFSSGSTGNSKAIVHRFDRLLNKFRTPRQTMVTMLFLQFDHIGGINTLLYTLANGGSAVIALGRTPEAVCQAIEKHGVEILPTSPTFLNLLLLSGLHNRFNLSSLKLITYGTEPMPQSTLSAVNKAFPNAKLQQTYGLSEVGILRSKSRDSGSLWVKVGGDEFDTKIINNRLWIKSESAMLGYLNAEAPFDDEGYFDTGDMVEQDGEWLKILGRESELINVGGEKVYPAEVESVVLDMDNVEDVAVRASAHPIVGQVVAADIKLVNPESLKDLKVRLRQHCQTRLAPYKIPSQIRLIDNYTHNARFKRMRKLG